MENARHDDPGEEVGQIGDGLHHLFPAVALYFIEQDCESNRCDKTERQIQHAHAEGVAQGTEEGDIAEQLYKFVETNELGAKQPVFGLIILKTDDPAPQGQIVEYKTEKQGIIEEITDFINKIDK